MTCLRDNVGSIFLKPGACQHTPLDQYQLSAVDTGQLFPGLQYSKREMNKRILTVHYRLTAASRDSAGLLLVHSSSCSRTRTHQTGKQGQTEQLRRGGKLQQDSEQ
jgi:hypothetical protein